MSLHVETLTVGYPGTRGAVLRNLDLHAAAGEFICVLGRNGSGKSTLMRTLAGLQRPLGGRVLLREEEVGSMNAATRARRIAVVLTERIDNAALTVEDVVSLGRQPYTGWNGVLSHDDQRIIADAAARAGAAVFMNRRFDALSDGEKQRVMIARALAQTPAMMVLDEITAFLDLPGRVEVMALLRRHARESGTITLLSSHDLDLSLQLADRLWLLDGRGALSVGTAAELIEAGRISDAFDTEGVTFSRALRRFELAQQ